MTEIFGIDPWWLTALKTVAIFVVLVLLTLFNIWAERRVVARMQQRIGPNRVGPQGLLQSLMDGVKLALKEDVIPKAVDRAVFILAPIVATIPAFLAWAVIPFGPEVLDLRPPHASAADRLPGGRAVHPGDRVDRDLRHRARRLVQRVDVPVARRPALDRADGVVRDRDEPVLRAVFLAASTMSTSGIVGAQTDRWFILVVPVSFLIYIVAMVGETNRAPFDCRRRAGMDRKAAINFARVGAQKLWAGTVTIRPDAKTGAHHHGHLESIIYVVKGKARMRWGEHLQFTAEAGPGDFIFVPPYVPHQEINASRDEVLECVLVRSDGEAVAINLDIEPVEKPETVLWVDPVHRRSG